MKSPESNPHVLTFDAGNIFEFDKSKYGVNLIELLEKHEVSIYDASCLITFYELLEEKNSLAQEILEIAKTKEKSIEVSNKLCQKLFQDMNQYEKVIKFEDDDSVAYKSEELDDFVHVPRLSITGEDSELDWGSNDFIDTVCNSGMSTSTKVLFGVAGLTFLGSGGAGYPIISALATSSKIAFTGAGSTKMIISTAAAGFLGLTSLGTLIAGGVSARNDRVESQPSRE